MLPKIGFAIIITFVPRKEMRYDTVGDWYYDLGGDLHIVIANDDPDYLSHKLQEAVALHELTEALLCKHAGVTQKQVDDFDFAWKDGQAEPGNSPDAPYHRQHTAADIVERVYLQEATSYNPTTNTKGD